MDLTTRVFSANVCSRWNSIPDEVIGCIFSKLDLASRLVGAGLVCKDWSRVAFGSNVHESSLRCSNAQHLVRLLDKRQHGETQARLSLSILLLRRFTKDIWETEKLQKLLQEHVGLIHRLDIGDPSHERNDEDWKLFVLWVLEQYRKSLQWLNVQWVSWVFVRLSVPAFPNLRKTSIEVTLAPDVLCTLLLSAVKLEELRIRINSKEQESVLLENLPASVRFLDVVSTDNILTNVFSAPRITCLPRVGLDLSAKCPIQDFCPVLRTLTQVCLSGAAEHLIPTFEAQITSSRLEIFLMECNESRATFRLRFKDCPRLNTLILANNCVKKEPSFIVSVTNCPSLRYADIFPDTLRDSDGIPAFLRALESPFVPVSSQD